MGNPFCSMFRDFFARISGRSLAVAGIGVDRSVGLSLACTRRDQSPGTARRICGNRVHSDAHVGEPLCSGRHSGPPDSTSLLLHRHGQGKIMLPHPTSQVANTGDFPVLPWGDGYGIAAHGIGIPDYTMDQIKSVGTVVGQNNRCVGTTSPPALVRWTGAATMRWSCSFNERGLKVMMSVVGSPAWSRTYFDTNPEAAPPDDLSLYVSFVGELVDRYKGKIHAIEVWNEQNLDREWDTEEGVKAERYVEMLRLTYQAIKSRDPSILVISGALSPTGVVATDPQNPERYTVVDDFAYFQQMIDAGFLNYADCVGAHHNGYNVPPDVAWDEGFDDPTATYRGPFDSPHHSWSFKSTLWGYHEMIKAAQRDTPLCVTEFGWASSEGYDGTPPGFEFALDNTLEEQAQWDVEAFQLMRNWGIVHLAFLWNLDYSYKGGIGALDPNTPYSILDLKGAARPAYGALGEMPKVP